MRWYRIYWLHRLRERVNLYRAEQLLLAMCVMAVTLDRKIIAGLDLGANLHLEEGVLSLV